MAWGKSISPRWHSYFATRRLTTHRSFEELKAGCTQLSAVLMGCISMITNGCTTFKMICLFHTTPTPICTACHSAAILVILLITTPPYHHPHPYPTLFFCLFAGWWWWRVNSHLFLCSLCVCLLYGLFALRFSKGTQRCRLKDFKKCGWTLTVTFPNTENH